MEPQEKSLLVLTPEMQMLLNDKTDGYNYRQRRQEDWDENYTLSRNEVVVNRLTQRQTVSLPVLKTVIRTLLKDVDDMPVVYFENLDNNKDAEIIKNEYWKVIGDEEHGKFEILDIIDKRQVFHFGRSYDQWQIIDGMPVMTIVDPMDILVPRHNDPTNIHKGRFLIHTHIFVPISVLEANEEYNQEVVQDLKTWYGTKMGLIKQADNENMLIEKNKKMQQMGVPDLDSPVLGEAYVELTLHFRYHKEEEKEDEQIYLYVTAEDQKILMKKPLQKVIDPNNYCHGWWKTHYPYNSWADDVEKQDWYSDGISDIVRPSAKVVNAWYSQIVENRTLRNFGMHYFNSNIEGYNPQTYEAKPWGWYGVPVPQGGSIADVMQKVDIPDLGESLDELQFVIGMIEKASGATTTQQGAENEKQITLGEIQLALQEAKERVKGMDKFYTQVWKERGIMFTMLLQAGRDKIDPITLYKKGRYTDNMYSREVSPKDWETPKGYRCKVWSQAEKSEKDTMRLEKLNATKANMPDNPIVNEEYQRKLLEFSEFSPDKINEAMEYEQQKRTAMMAGGMIGMDGMPVMQMQPNKQAALPRSAPQLTGGAK